MDKREFSNVRSILGKTQVQMAHILGVSCKAIQSFEQGWRKIPVHIERQVLFLLLMKKKTKRTRPCWAIRQCPKDTRKDCPAWEFKMGHLCWFINGTVCHGKVQDNWQRKMKLCRKCEVFRSMVPYLQGKCTTIARDKMS